MHTNFVNNYKQTTLAQYLVSLGATILEKSKSRSDKVVNFLNVNKERIFHVHMLEERLCIVLQKHVLRQYFRLKLLLNLLLMFHKISGSCSYKIVRIKRVYSKVLYGKCVLVCMACLFRSTIGEIVKLINISNKEWLPLLEKIFYFTRRQDSPTFLRYYLYSMPTTSLYDLSGTNFLGVFP